MANRKLRTITAEDLYEFNTVAEVRISPDGQNVVYTVQRVDRKTEKKYTNLWVVSTKEGDPRQFTIGDQHDGSGRFSPDGKAIAFLSDRRDREKPAQIYLIPFTGGKPADLPRSLVRLEKLAGHLTGSKSCVLCEKRM